MVDIHRISPRTWILNDLYLHSTKNKLQYTPYHITYECVVHQQKIEDKFASTTGHQREQSAQMADQGAAGRPIACEYPACQG